MLLFKYIIVTGEELKSNLAARWLRLSPHIRLVNAYGLTETSDDITHYVIKQVRDMEKMPVGKPLQNLNIYIVDENMKLCPIGVQGEICVSGISVGRGYLNDAEKTKRLFLENPFTDDKRERLFKTGDLGRWLSNGTIEFFGRRDHQVKIRGFRIELEEIESHLLTHDQIKDAVVLAYEKKFPANQENDSKYLCAYIVTENAAQGNEFSVSHLIEYLANRLPDYMIPSYFTRIDSVPLKPNGKVDRQALPLPEDKNIEKPFAAPRNEIEVEIARVWQEILGADRVGIDDNFFELGGNSINAIKVTARLENKLDFDLRIDVLFLHPTIRQISDHLFPQKDQQEEFTAEEILKSEKNDYEIPGNITGLRNKLTGPERQQIIDEIDSNDELSSLLKKNKITKEYEISLVQRVFLLEPGESIGQNIFLCSYDFDQFNDFTNLKPLLVKIINENSLLRSIMVKSENSYFVREFDSFLNVRIPLIDISIYSHRCKEEILFMVKQSLYKHFEIFNHLLYRIIAVKWDHRRYKIFFAFNHLIFDGQSVTVLSKKIHTQDDDPGNSGDSQGRKLPTKEYFDYIAFLNGLNYEDIKLERYLDLEEYSRYISKVLNKFQIGELQYDDLEIDIENLSKNSRYYYNEIILLCYANLIKDLYGLKKVPLLFMSNGRSYKDGNFTEVIGNFPDIIPVLLSFENGSNPVEIIKEFINYREYITNHNLNFVNYFSKNREARKKYGMTSLSPFKFNPIIGAYHFYKDRYQDRFLKEWAKKNIKGPFFELYMSKDLYSTKVFIYYLHNSVFKPGDLKNRFSKNYEDVVQGMTA